MSGSLEDELGDVLEKSRDGKGWTQSDLAQASGMSVSDISRMERYEFVPDDSVLKKLAEVLDLHVPSLIAVAKGTWAPKAIEPDPGPFEIICLDLFVGTYPVKCYLLICKATKTSAVIDTGGNPEAIIKKAKELNIKPEKILLTHAHFDHIGGIADLVKSLPEMPPVYLHPDDYDLWKDGGGGARFGIQIDPGPEPIPLEHGQMLRVGKFSFEARHTPGHRPGHSVFFCAEAGVLFSGDLIFYRSVGRTDLPGGNWATLEKSIHEQIYTLPAETQIFSGHGDATSVGDEKVNNHFVKA